jgi:hypothetical protein
MCCLGFCAQSSLAAETSGLLSSVHRKLGSINCRTGPQADRDVGDDECREVCDVLRPCADLQYPRPHLPGKWDTPGRTFPVSGIPPAAPSRYSSGLAALNPHVITMSVLGCLGCARLSSAYPNPPAYRFACAATALGRPRKKKKKKKKKEAPGRPRNGTGPPSQWHRAALAMALGRLGSSPSECVESKYRLESGVH